MMATRRLRLWVLPVSLAVAASAFMEPRRVRTFHPRGQLSSRSTVLASGKLLLEVSGLQAEVSEAEKRILKGLDLIVRAGEVHAIMGPNGSGKSTLSKVLARHPAYGILDGSAIFDGQDLVEMEAVDASRAGIFLAFQYPIELPGVGNSDFLRVMLNEKRKAEGLEELDPLEFLAVATRKCELVKMDPTFLARNVNEGFSGGEKKRNEILQMAMLEPKLAILDETDSGLDIDALRTISDGINSLRRPDNAFIIITHYQRLLDYIQPDFVHVMANGKIVKTGGAELALELEQSGYVFT